MQASSKRENISFMGKTSHAISPLIEDNHWVRRPEDFAVRIDADDLPGLFNHGIRIEPGTNAMLIEKGANQGILPPGEYRLATLGETMRAWLAGLPTGGATVLLVCTDPADLVFPLGGVFTKDPLPIGVSVHLQIQVHEPGRFLANRLHGSQRLTLEELRQYLYPEVANLTIAWMRRFDVQQLANDLSLKENFEMALEEALSVTLVLSGMKMVQVRAMDFNLECLDRINGITSRYGLQVSEAEAELAGRKRLADASQEVNLQALIEETRKVEYEEQRLPLFQRMRVVAVSDRMDEVRSADDFAAFLDQMDRQKLLRENTRAEMLRDWRENAEDHDRARAHLIAKIDLEMRYEQNAIELKLRSDLNDQQLEAEMAFERKKLESTISLEERKQEFELKRQHTLAEMNLQMRQAEDAYQQKLRDQKRSDDMADANMGMELLHQMQAQRMEKQKAELELKLAADSAALDLELDKQRRVLEIEIRRMEVAHRQKMELLGVVKDQGEMGLIMAGDPVQIQALQTVLLAKIAAGRSPEQIWAEASAQNPEAARIYNQIKSSQPEQQEKMFREMLALMQDQQRIQLESQRQNTDVQQAIYDRGLQTAAQIARDVAQIALAGSGKNPVVLNAAGGGQVTAAEKLCPKCGNFVNSADRFCSHCGNAFAGIN